MTRLRTDDVQGIPAKLHEYDLELRRKTGCSLRRLACHAAGIEIKKVEDQVHRFPIGIIPVTSGKGVIKGFSDAVYGIVSHLGFAAFITEATDVAGLAEAFRRNADAIVLSDDTQFVAINIQSRHVIDNSEATARGYVAGLDQMVSGVNARRVLVIGCGPVGSAAANELVLKGAAVSLFDIDVSRCLEIRESIKRELEKEIQVTTELETALRTTHLIIDATPARNIIKAHHVGPDTYIAAPGVPPGLDPEAQSEIGDRLLHDPLEIGVATMAFSALKWHMQNPLDT
ncbi:MAG: 3-methylornithyl-N6-L-lysine dehydrogenase PylD [Deltaproteobacteria bacterium]|nr:3-methylornithyl-N6-L-lysine dehydrogenase PylD [Deltaproteobacteria bacterium]